MPVASSASPGPEHPDSKNSVDESAETHRPVFDVPSAHRWRMVVMGYIPFLHFAAVLILLVLPILDVLPRRLLLAVPLALYLVPPLACRLTSLLVPLPEGRFEVGSKAFLRWWFYAQWQVLFNRFPFLEEFLRMMPAFYSAWLRLWGAKIGALVYWSSGVTVLDRPCLQIGNRVVLGAGVSLSPHVLMPDESRRLKLFIAPIQIGDDTLIGGYALLAPGCRIAAGEILPAFLRLPPFCHWQDGKRTRQGSADWMTALALITPKAEVIGEDTT